MSASGLWETAAAVAAVLTLCGALVTWGVQRVRAAVERGVQSQNEENRRLREELDLRFRLPAFATDAVKLTEVAAERKIEDLTRQYEDAVAAQNNERAEILESQLKEVGQLRARLETVSAERDKLQARLQDAVVIGHPPRGTNGIGLQTGLILLIRHHGRYSAVQAVQHAASNPGRERNFVRYVWWHQPDGSGIFVNENAQFGSGLAHEGQGSTRTDVLQIGPIKIQWSAGSNNYGWVYFGPTTSPDPEYELAHTREIDISKINAGSPVHQYLRGSVEGGHPSPA